MMQTGYPLQIQYITLYFSTAPVYERMSFLSIALPKESSLSLKNVSETESFDVVLVFFSQ